MGRKDSALMNPLLLPTGENSILESIRKLENIESVGTGVPYQGTCVKMLGIDGEVPKERREMLNVRLYKQRKGTTNSFSINFT